MQIAKGAKNGAKIAKKSKNLFFTPVISCLQIIKKCAILFDSGGKQKLALKNFKNLANTQKKIK